MVWNCGFHRRSSSRTPQSHEDEQVTRFASQLLPPATLATLSDDFRTAAAMGGALPWITVALLVAAIAILAWVPAQRKRAGAAIILFLGGFAFLLVSAAMLSGSYTT